MIDEKELELSFEYKLYMQSAPWRILSDMVKQRAGYTCEICSAVGKKIGGFATLHVHHLTYERFGEEDMSDLVCLCSNCHRKVHNGRIVIDRNILSH